MSTKVLGIVGSYRKGGIIDSLVTEALSSAEKEGAETTKVYLVDQHIEFCRNCRQCAREPGSARGQCVHDDDMGKILTQHEQSDALVLGAPVNFFNVNAMTRRFMERLVCYAYWPWGTRGGPKMRVKSRGKKAVLITSSAMPATMGRLFTGAPRALRIMTKTMGAKPVASLFVGLIAADEHASPPAKALRKARNAGRRLVGG